MSDSSGEKTEEPTQKKIRDARNRGQVSKSNDVIGAAMLLMLFSYFSMSWTGNLEKLSLNLVAAAHFFNLEFRDALKELSKVNFIAVTSISLPFVVIAMVAAVASNLAQIGFLFSVESLTPDLNKLNPIEGAKKIFSVKNLVEFLKNCLKVMIIGYVVYTLVQKYVDPLIKAPREGIYGVLSLLEPIFFEFIYTILVVYIVIAFADYKFQNHQYIKNLKMTKDEVKREYKESEGDPEIKGKRKQIHEEMVMSDAVENTQKSSVLVTNPTHYAVALFYESEKVKLPIVMAKGKDYVALNMMDAARKANIPIMQNVPLAQALYREAPLKQFIPKDLLKPVAEVLIAIQEIKNS
jgi:type III secretion protein U